MSAYETFIDEISTEYDEIWELASGKCNEEETTILASMVGLAGIIVYISDEELGNPSASKSEETKRKLLEFAERYCFDYSGLEKSKKALRSAANVMELETGGFQRKISGGLATWTSAESHAAEVFAENYVDTITTRYGRLQYEFGRSDTIIDSVGEIVEANRDALRDLLRQLRERLDSYTPIALVYMRLAEITMMGAGLAVGPVSAAGLTVASVIMAGETQNLSGSTGRGVAGFFDAFRLAIDRVAALRKDVYDQLASEITIHQNGLRPGDYVFSRPSSFDENGQRI